MSETAGPLLRSQTDRNTRVIYPRSGLSVWIGGQYHVFLHCWTLTFLSFPKMPASWILQNSGTGKNVQTIQFNQSAIDIHINARSVPRKSNCFTLPETKIAPEHKPSKRNVLSQRLIVTVYVGFKEGSIQNHWFQNGYKHILVLGKMSLTSWKNNRVGGN